MANLPWSSRTSRFETAIWVAKIAFCCLGFFSFGAAARATVPAVAGALASALPAFRAFIRSWLAPPYLFIAVHLIIFVIWKLSDQKQHHHHHEHWAGEEKTPSEAWNHTKIKSFEPSVTAGLLRKPAPEICREKISPPLMTVAVPAPDPGEHSPSDASCLTTESDKRSTASSASAGRRSVEPESKSRITLLEEEDEEAAAAAAAAAAGIENESMEATWKAIMERSPRPATIPRQPVAAPSSASHSESDRRFDDFIKKNREQIQLLTGRRRQ